MEAGKYAEMMAGNTKINTNSDKLLIFPHNPAPHFPQSHFLASPVLAAPATVASALPLTFQT